MTSQLQTLALAHLQEPKHGDVYRVFSLKWVKISPAMILADSEIDVFG